MRGAGLHGTNAPWLIHVDTLIHDDTLGVPERFSSRVSTRHTATGCRWDQTGCSDCTPGGRLLYYRALATISQG